MKILDKKQIQMVSGGRFDIYGGGGRGQWGSYSWLKGGYTFNLRPNISITPHIDIRKVPGQRPKITRGDWYIYWFLNMAKYIALVLFTFSLLSCTSKKTVIPTEVPSDIEQRCRSISYSKKYGWKTDEVTQQVIYNRCMRGEE